MLWTPPQHIGEGFRQPAHCYRTEIFAVVEFQAAMGDTTKVGLPYATFSFTVASAKVRSQPEADPGAGNQAPDFIHERVRG